MDLPAKPLGFQPVQDGPGTELAAFVARDPDTAGCLIELRDG